MSVVEDSSPAAPSPQPVPSGSAPRGPGRRGRGGAAQGPLVGAAPRHRARAARRSSPTRRGRPSQRELLRRLDHGRDYLSPFYSPCLTNELPDRGTYGGRSRRRLVDDLAGVPDPRSSPGLPRSPATTTARPTTARSGSRRRPAPSPTPARPSPAGCVAATPARPASRSSCRTSTATSGTSRVIFAGLLDLGRDRGVPLPRRDRHGPRHADLRRQRGLHLGLHARLPLLPPPLRRRPEAVLEAPGAATGSGRTSRRR